MRRIIFLALASLSLSGCMVVVKERGHVTCQREFPYCEKGRPEPVGPHKDEVPTPVYFFGIRW
jgi:hypothetical protein